MQTAPPLPTLEPSSSERVRQPRAGTE